MDIKIIFFLLTFMIFQSICSGQNLRNSVNRKNEKQNLIVERELLFIPKGQNEPTCKISAHIITNTEARYRAGEIIFSQWHPEEPVRVTINATGLLPGKHAVHLHEFGDITEPEHCNATGSHLPRALIGNIEVKEDGTVFAKFISPYISIFGPDGVIGRSIVLHYKPIEYRRFPDVYAPPFYPSFDEPQDNETEEEMVGPIIACGIITYKKNVDFVSK